MRPESLTTGRTWQQVLVELLKSCLPTGRHGDRKSAAPFVRDPGSVERLLLYFIIASAPAMLIGVLALGGHVAEAMLRDSTATLPGWRGSLLALADMSRVEPGLSYRLLLGLLYFLPLLFASLIVSMVWEVVFATARRRPVDPGWLMTAWLYALLLPATLPVWLAALGMSFGTVIGKHVFGGTGRYIVSPAALGVVFLMFGYPAFFADDRFVPLSAIASTWEAIANGGALAAAESSMSWFQVFSGREIAAIGTPSALACFLGALFLIYKGAASARTVIGAVAGAVVMSVLLNSAAPGDPAWQIPWYWHIGLGSFAFGAAFLATDPTTSALTPYGRWLQGGLIGALTVLIRIVNPAHPDGTLFAIVLSCLATPLIDNAVVSVRMSRWRARARKRA